MALGVTLASEATVRVERAMTDLRERERIDGGLIGYIRAQYSYREVGNVTAWIDSGRGGVICSMRAAVSEWQRGIWDASCHA